MDSVTQFALGAAVAGSLVGARVRPWRAVWVGGALATLPDLDVLWDFGDPIADMTMHRADTHSLLWLTLASVPLAWLIRRLWPGVGLARRSWTVWCILVTHVLIDWLTIYGTKWLLPFTDHAYGLGSQFVVDPLFTLPLLVGLAGLLASDRAGRKWNAVGLVLCAAYAAWGAGMQQYAQVRIVEALVRSDLQVDRLVVTAAPLQTLLWRGVAVVGDRWCEVHWSPFDGAAVPTVVSRSRGEALERELVGHPRVRQLIAFSGGMVRFEEDARGVRVADLRMGQDPYFPFDFLVATRGADGLLQFVEPTQQIAQRVPVGAGLRWLWARMWGDRDASVR